jgi:hypothetical protein
MATSSAESRVLGARYTVPITLTCAYFAIDFAWERARVLSSAPGARCYDRFMNVNFDRMPPDARLWVFAAERRLTAGEQERLLDAVDEFLDGWKAHGHPLSCARDLRHGQFLFVAVDQSTAGASGCSIDAMVRTLTALERELGLELVNHGPVLYRAEDGIRREMRPAFAARAARGEVTADTIVFDNTLTRMGDLQAGRWEVPARESWHGRAFFQSKRAPVEQ